MKVLFCGRIFAQAPVFLAKALPTDEIVSCDTLDAPAQSVDADVLIPLMTPITRSIIEGSGAGLIQQWGVGLEGVDIGYATEKGVRVCNVPGDVTYNADSTAEHAIFLMMALARRMNEFGASFESNSWGSPTGRSLFEARALIVGLGRVGRALARKLKALGMLVQAISRDGRIPEEDKPYVDSVGKLSDLLNLSREADFVISTTSLNDQTRGLFDSRLFNSMRDTAFVINVSRGPVVIDADLLEALSTGKIAGAGLDVFSTEPFSANRDLLASPKVVASPHIAGVTIQNYIGICSVVAENIKRLKEFRPLQFCANFSDTEI
jgi:phosphoglycerate dehydrogenase-like enzyme